MLTDNNDNGNYLPKYRDDDTPKLIESLEKYVAKGGNALDFLLPKVAPNVVGQRMIPAKLATLIWAASLNKIGQSRGRLHCLLFGKPATSKTRFLEFWQQELGCEMASPKSTKASLTVNLAGRIPQPGALVRASRLGFLVVEELHSFPRDQQQIMLQALESGYFHAGGGGHNAIMPATCRVLAAANTVSKFSPEFLSRFDMRVYFPSYTKDETKQIVGSIIDGSTDENRTGIGKFIYAIKDFEVSMNNDAKKYFKDTMNYIIDEYSDSYIDLREMEAIRRAAYAISKLNMRDVTLQDIDRAIDIMMGIKKLREQLESQY